ncbi:MAG: hypothetical protein K2Q26_08170 [Bdellovibrionales bacterium]|nr:hypothetical protein [Bdellovibrionales bacterium]
MKNLIICIVISIVTSALTTASLFYLSDRVFSISVNFKPIPRASVSTAPIAGQPLNVDVDPCQDDAGKFCSASKNEPGGVNACLLDYIDQVQPMCAIKLNNILKKWDPCRSDIDRLCSGVRPGRLRWLKCLEEKLSQTTPQCHDHLMSIKGRNK